MADTARKSNWFDVEEAKKVLAEWQHKQPQASVLAVIRDVVDTAISQGDSYPQFLERMRDALAGSNLDDGKGAA